MENKCSDAWHFLICCLLQVLPPCPAPGPAALCNFFMGFLLLLIPDVLLPSARRPVCPALLDGGAYPFLEKPKYHFLPPKIPAIFPKTSPYPTIFNTAYT